MRVMTGFAETTAGVGVGVAVGVGLGVGNAVDGDAVDGVADSGGDCAGEGEAGVTGASLVVVSVGLLWHAHSTNAARVPRRR